MTRHLLLTCLTLTTLASAQSPAPESAAVANAEVVVKKTLLSPLAEKESRRSRFSRAMAPPTARRLRITAPVAQVDERGRPFFSFAVDVRRGLVFEEDEAPTWTRDAVSGCVYPKTNEVFVKNGETWVSSDLLLGKRVKPAEASTCRAAVAEVARVP
jgi:hypothetical protein